jgi:hypothetical protein
MTNVVCMPPDGQGEILEEDWPGAVVVAIETARDEEQPSWIETGGTQVAAIVPIGFAQSHPAFALFFGNADENGEQHDYVQTLPGDTSLDQEGDALTNEQIYTAFKDLQNSGCIDYVLPTSPLGEEWIIGQQGQIVKLTGKGQAMAYLMGTQAVLAVVQASVHGRTPSTVGRGLGALFPSVSG